MTEAEEEILYNIFIQLMVQRNKSVPENVFANIRYKQIDGDVFVSGDN